MPSWETLAAFVIASSILIAIPGPSVLFVVGRSLAHGRRCGLMSVLGNELDALVLVAAVALGVGSVVAQSIVLFTAVKLVGAAYLIYLGIHAMRQRTVHFGDATRPRSLSSWVSLRQGFFVGVTNPKTIVFFVAVLPQFVIFDAGNVVGQMFILGLIFTVVVFACDSAWVLAAGAARGWFATSAKRLVALRTAGGAMMVGLGGALALTGTKA